MRRLLMVVFAPFALVGGALIGYYAHAIRLLGEFDYMSVLDYPYLLLGLALVLVGFLIRHRLIQSYEREIKRKEGLIDTMSDQACKAELKVEELTDRMQWVEEVIQKAVREKDDNVSH